MASDVLMHSIYKDCVYILFLWNHVNVSLKVSAPCWLIVIFILNLSCSAFLTATFSAIAEACVWVPVSSQHLFLWHFTYFFLTHTYPQISNKTCQPHVSLFSAVTCTHILVETSSFFWKVKLLLTVILKSTTCDNYCNIFYLTAILWITHHLNKLNPAWKTY